MTLPKYQEKQNYKDIVKFERQHNNNEKKGRLPKLAEEKRKNTNLIILII